MRLGGKPHQCFYTPSSVKNVSGRRKRTATAGTRGVGIAWWVWVGLNQLKKSEPGHGSKKG
eukprot:3702236-Prymnesium_polylepis.1